MENGSKRLNRIVICSIALMCLLWLIGFAIYQRRFASPEVPVCSTIKLSQDPAFQSTFAQPRDARYGLPYITSIYLPDGSLVEMSGPAVASGLDDDTLILILRPRWGTANILVYCLGMPCRQQGESISAFTETNPPVRMIISDPQKITKLELAIPPDIARLLRSQIQTPTAVLDGSPQDDPIYVSPP